MTILYLISQFTRWSIIVMFAVVFGVAIGEISTAMLASQGWV